MTSQTTTQSYPIARNQWTSHKSLGPALLHLLLNAPRLKCAISHSSVKQAVRRRMYDPPWHLSSFLSQMCKHYYPWVILSAVVKILLSSFSDTPSKHDKQRVGTELGGKKTEWAEGKSDGNGADVCVAADLWPDKSATQAAGIDGLLVRTGPSVRCFQNDWFTIKWLRVCACRQNWCRSIPLKLIDQPFSLAVCLPNKTKQDSPPGVSPSIKQGRNTTSGPVSFLWRWQQKQAISEYEP